MQKQKNIFERRLKIIQAGYQTLTARENKKLFSDDGICNRYRYPVLTRRHVPLHWRYDLNRETNPLLLERIGFNAVFNAGAIKFQGKYVLVARVEGKDRKSFFAVAESTTGIDHFRFRHRPISLPQTENPDTNVYDMRLTAHDDGWIYGVFCSERRDPDASEGDTSAAVAAAGIARTKDLETWERLPDLVSHSGQQRNVVLFPHFIDGKYAFYTRPQDGFIDTGSGGGIGFGLADNIEEAKIDHEEIVDAKIYHTIYEVKNGLGPAPIRTEQGWLQLAHGVRNTAAGLRYTLYLFMTDLKKPWLVTFKPHGYLLAPFETERTGDVSNVLFSGGWIKDDDGRVFIYYASSDTRMHVATTTVEKLIDYCRNTPADRFCSTGSVQTINQLIDRNEALMNLTDENE